MNDLVMQMLALTGIVIVAMALSAGSTGAKLVQAGLAIAIIGVLLRSHSEFEKSWNDLTTRAISITKESSSS